MLKNQITYHSLYPFLGSNVHAKDKNGDTPLHLAIKLQNTEIAAALIKAGALLDMPKAKIGDLVNKYVCTFNRSCNLLCLTLSIAFSFSVVRLQIAK